MKAALVLFLIAGVLTANPDEEESLESKGELSNLSWVRQQLEASPPSARDRWVARLATQLDARQVPALLEALEEWPPQEALRLRAAVIRSERLRAGLVREVCLHNSPAAAELLWSQFVLRSREVEPWTARDIVYRDRLSLLTPPGLRVRLFVPDSLELSLHEWVRLLQDSGVSLSPLVVFPGVMDKSPPVRGIHSWRPAEWMLHHELGQRELAAVRLPRATWIVPQQWAEQLFESGWPESPAQRETVLREAEGAWFRKMLEAVALLDAERRPWVVAECLAQLGLPCQPSPSDHDSFDLSVAWVAAAYRGGPVPAGPFPSLQAGRSLATRALLRTNPEDWTGRDLEPALRSFLVARQRPLAAREAATGFLQGDEANWTMAALVGCSAKKTDDARLPWSWRTPPQEFGSAERAMIESLGLELELAASSPRLRMKESTDPRSVWEALEEVATTSDVLLHLLSQELSSEDIRTLVGAMMGALPASRSQWQRRLDLLLRLLAARVDEDSLLVGLCRSRMRQGFAEEPSPEIREDLEQAITDLLRLGSLSRDVDWQIDLSGLGWVPGG